ncbi:MAG TPA: MBL fold metallo-hydrolase [Syntrophales bacterium]|jgi:phosphoribosyl 1,2-cyclic phosphodiesterase|nr:MBL fold metallo-hydrolase [Syntrophales bacterium]
MIIRCWGARGSIPVSGSEYLKYGGDTTCIEIRTKSNDVILIDAGSGIRRLGNQLMAEGVNSFTMIFTHAHWDHLMGFPFFKPIYFPKISIAMYGCSYAQSSLKEIISRVMEPPHFPVNFEDIRADIVYHEACVEEFRTNSVTISTIPISHPNQGEGFKFEEDGKTFVFLTDNELMYKHPGGCDFEDYMAFSRGADLLIHDAEYTETEYLRTRAWGHSVYTDALNLALEAGVQRLGLFHHNQERSDDQVDAIVQDCRRLIKREGRKMDCFALHQNMEIKI